MALTDIAEQQQQQKKLRKKKNKDRKCLQNLSLKKQVLMKVNE